MTIQKRHQNLQSINEILLYKYGVHQPFVIESLTKVLTLIKKKMRYVHCLNKNKLVCLQTALHWGPSDAVPQRVQLISQLHKPDVGQMLDIARLDPKCDFAVTVVSLNYCSLCFIYPRLVNQQVRAVCTLKMYAWRTSGLSAWHGLRAHGTDKFLQGEVVVNWGHNQSWIIM